MKPQQTHTACIPNLCHALCKFLRWFEQNKGQRRLTLGTDLSVDTMNCMTMNQGTYKCALEPHTKSWHHDRISAIANLTNVSHYGIPQSTLHFFVYVPVNQIEAGIRQVMGMLMFP